MSKKMSLRTLSSVVLLVTMTTMSHPLISTITQHPGVIRGRLVDKKGVSIGNGSVVFVPIDRSDIEKSALSDLVVPYFSTDAEGRFAIPVDSVPEAAMLFGISGLKVDSRCIAPIFPPFSSALGVLPEYMGRKIEINRTADTNMGDISCQLYYASAKFTFSSRKGLQFDRLRLRDWRGNIVRESVLVKPVNVTDGVCMTLPYGTWYIEFGRGQECADWYSLGKVVYADGMDLALSKGLTKSDGVVHPFADPRLARRNLEELGVTPGRASLSRSAEYGNRSVVRMLLDLGLDPDEIDEDGVPPIIKAAMGCYNDIVIDLLAKGANPNAVSVSGITAIMAASGNCGCGSVVTEFIAHGGDVNRRTADGVTALMLAAGNGHNEAVKNLLKAGADRYAKDKQGKTALDIASAAGSKDILKLLTEKKK